MTEYRLFEGDVAYVSTAEFHAPRERAPHLEQEDHEPRLRATAKILTGLPGAATLTLSDLGCGDGGLLSLVQGSFASVWGYDFCPANLAGAEDRGVKITSLDVFGADRDQVRCGDVVVMTEVTEHLSDPHGVLRWLRGRCTWLMMSSPFTETDAVHVEEHAWAWDEAGYGAMITGAGWEIVTRETVLGYQLVLSR